MNHKGKRSDLDHKAALMEAIRQNDIAKVVSLIENGVDIEPLSTLWLDSPLKWAIYMGHKFIVKILISKGAKTNLRDSDSFFPIHWAVRRNQKEIVEILLQNGADVNAKCGYSSPTPIYYALKEANIEIVKILLSYDAKIDEPNQDNVTPIHEAVYANQKSILEMFLKTYPNLTKPCFNSILQFAIYSNMPDIAEMLINYGVQIDAYYTEIGATPIHVAVGLCENNALENTKMLLRKGASMKIKNIDGYTPLECALKKDNGKKLDFMKVITYHQHN